MLLDLRRRRNRAPVVHTGQAPTARIFQRVRFTELHVEAAVAFEGLEAAAEVRFARLEVFDLELLELEAGSTYRYIPTRTQRLRVRAVSDLVDVFEYEGRARYVSRALEIATRNRRLLIDLEEL